MVHVEMNKLKKLQKSLKNLRRVVVAYSGGLDSTFLLKTAIDTLGRENVLAVTARSKTYPVFEYKEAAGLAKRLGARHVTLHTEELKVRNFKSNPVNRCYYCKKELFKKLNDIKTRHSMAFIIDGTNFDDLKDIRYGRKAAVESGVRSPLLEAGMGKADIRRSSKSLKLPTWDKPSFACLASRIPFNDEITVNGLRRIDKAENYLRQLSFKQFRVRVHKDIARIEILKAEFAKAVKMHERIAAKLKKLGFTYITLDLCGYRTGSMHETV